LRSFVSISIFARPVSSRCLTSEDQSTSRQQHTDTLEELTSTFRGRSSTKLIC